MFQCVGWPDRREIQVNYIQKQLKECTPEALCYIVDGIQSRMDGVSNKKYRLYSKLTIMVCVTLNSVMMRFVCITLTKWGSLLPPYPHPPSSFDNQPKMRENALSLVHNQLHGRREIQWTSLSNKGHYVLILVPSQVHHCPKCEVRNTVDQSFQ